MLFAASPIRLARHLLDLANVETLRDDFIRETLRIVMADQGARRAGAQPAGMDMRDSWNQMRHVGLTTTRQTNRGPDMKAYWIATTVVALSLPITVAASHAQSCNVASQGARKCFHGKQYVCGCSVRTGKKICDWYLTGHGCR